MEALIASTMSCLFSSLVKMLSSFVTGCFHSLIPMISGIFLQISEINSKEKNFGLLVSPEANEEPILSSYDLINEYIHKEKDLSKHIFSCNWKPKVVLFFFFLGPTSKHSSENVWEMSLGISQMLSKVIWTLFALMSSTFI